MSQHTRLIPKGINTYLEDFSQFAAGVAHDVANPLNAISMHAELLKILLERGQSEQAHEVLERLINDCNRCGQLIEGIRNFATNILPYSHEALSIGEIVDNAVALVAAKLEFRPDAIRIHFSGPPPHIFGNRLGLSQSIANIICNAFEAEACEIDIDIATQNEETVIKINDNGIGISSTAFPNILQPFFSTRRSTDCIGLGLTLVQSVIFDHEGTLTINNNIDRGVLVTITLPNGKHIQKKRPKIS